MTATPNHKREALTAILAAHPGNTCEAQCARIRAALMTPIKKAAGGYDTTTTAFAKTRLNAALGHKKGHTASERRAKVAAGATKHHGFDDLLTSCDISRSYRTWSAAFEFVPPVFGGSNGRAQALPVSARMSRFANPFESPPPFSDGCVGFCKSTSLEAIMAQSSRALAPSLSALGNTSPLARQQEIENALSMALYHVRHCDKVHGLQAATGRAHRALTLMKHACAESTISVRA